MTQRVPNDYTFAFQPIVDGLTGRVFSYEALLTGSRGESAASVSRKVLATQIRAFDRDCRRAAVELAQRLKIPTYLNLNALPRAILKPVTGLKRTLEVAMACGLSFDRLIVEISELELMDDHVGFARNVEQYRAMGVRFAIDHFGSGTAGINLLADVGPDFLKIDQCLTRGIAHRRKGQILVRAILKVCYQLGIKPVADGIESIEEYQWYQAEGVNLFQGIFIGEGEFECLKAPVVPFSASRIGHLLGLSSAEIASVP